MNCFSTIELWRRLYRLPKVLDLPKENGTSLALGQMVLAHLVFRKGHLMIVYNLVGYDEDGGAVYD